MTRTLGARRGATLAAGLSLVALVAAGCGASSTTSSSSGGSATAAGGSGGAQSALLRTSATKLGTIVVDGKGRTVYMFAKDTPGHSNCTGTCLTFWPPVTAGASAPSQLAGIPAKVGVITRDDGSKQLTLAGLPVYTYAGDKTAGATNGQGKNAAGGLWWVFSPSGAVIKSKGGGSAPASSGYSRGGYGY